MSSKTAKVVVLLVGRKGSLSNTNHYSLSVHNVHCELTPGPRWGAGRSSRRSRAAPAGPPSWRPSWWRCRRSSVGSSFHPPAKTHLLIAFCLVFFNIKKRPGHVFLPCILSSLIQLQQVRAFHLHQA